MIFDLETVNNIKILALKSVLKPDEEYLCRQLIRWFSKTFNVSYFEAQQIPILELLQHNFEDQYETLKHDPDKQEELQKLMKELIETNQQKSERLKKEAEDEMDETAFLKKIADKILEQESVLDKNKKEQGKPVRDMKNEFPDISMNFENPNEDLETDNLKINKNEFSLLTPSKKTK